MSDLQSIRQQVTAKVDALRQMMASHSLDERIEVWHEFVQLTPAQQQQVQDTAESLGRLPKSAELFGKSATIVASALSAGGKLSEAQSLLVDARHTTSRAEGALIAYNLFQVRTRLGNYDEAMDILNSAIRADAARFALHDTKKYPPLRMMGAGSLGCSFQCENAAGGKPVALKALWEKNPSAGEAIFDEAKALPNVNHPAVLKPLDFGFSDPGAQAKPFYVFERVPGAVSAEAWLEKNGPLSLEQAKQVGTTLIEMLAHAHAAGICHLNLNPGNVLLKRMGPNLDVKVTDWGLGRSTASLKGRVLQTPNQIGNSPLGKKLNAMLDYLAPEQQGNLQYGTPGPMADYYAFGSTMYKLITGQAPRDMAPESMAANPDMYRILETLRREDPGTRTESAQELHNWWHNPQILVDKQAAQREAAREAEMIALGGVRKEPVEAEAAKSKLPMIIGIVAGVVVLGGLGAYFAFGGKKEEKTDKKAKVEKVKPAVTQNEMDRLEKWYKGARAAVWNFMSPTCQPLHDKGYKFDTKITPVLMKKEKRGRLRTYRVFKLALEGSSSAVGKLDIFDCPGRLAKFHGEHTVTIDIWVRFYRANMFSRGHRLGVVKLSGKFMGYLEKKKYNSGVLFKNGLSLPGLRRASDPGVSALGRRNRGKLSKCSMTVSNITFKRVVCKRKSRGIEGHWQAKMRNEKYAKDVNDWATGCKSTITGALGKLIEVKRKHKVHRRLAMKAQDWVDGFCKALVLLNGSLKPYSPSGVSTAVAQLQKARKNWNDNIYKPLVKVANSVDAVIKTPGM